MRTNRPPTVEVSRMFLATARRLAARIAGAPCSRVERERLARGICAVLVLGLRAPMPTRIAVDSSAQLVS